MAKAKTSKKQLVELRDPVLSSKAQIQPTFEWFAFPALIWAFYTLGSNEFMNKATEKVEEFDPEGPLALLFPGSWIYQRLKEAGVVKE